MSQHQGDLVGVNVMAQILLYLQCKRVDVLAHVCVSHRKPDPGAARNRDHRARAFNVALTNAAGA